MHVNKQKDAREESKKKKKKQKIRTVSLIAFSGATPISCGNKPIETKTAEGNIIFLIEKIVLYQCCTETTFPTGNIL